MKNKLQNNLKYYIQISRFDKPIGWWLLFIPCIYSLGLASVKYNSYPDLYLIFLFLIGSIIMRAVGCIFNDIIDRRIDAKVERTKNRPLASNKITLSEALFLMFILSLIGLSVLLQFNSLTILIGLSSIITIIIYPFMKRITYWPQLFLGISFNWGALVGWTSISNNISIEMIFVYFACLFWTLGYDTIYGYQDIEDDKKIGIKSTSRLFGKETKKHIWFFYFIKYFLLINVMYIVNVNIISYSFLLIAITYTAKLIKNVDIQNPDSCLIFFKKNRNIGLINFLAISLSVFIG
ncbi:MAG: 4-hydroxybenzoate octaprenyltransferase [Alphaproteobacteria bacterium]|jgi:4-hydroxybenzoate polyprenyltransferase|tara:strand:+ start:17679 stop:18557 length:879 start_codon:yes stop_codon:yes gene_type:complete